MKTLLMCRICGYKYRNFYPWGKDGDLPSHDICECCGCEFGYEDVSSKSILVNRSRWAEQGYPWFTIAKKPKNWSVEKQLSNVLSSTDLHHLDFVNSESNTDGYPQFIVELDNVAEPQTFLILPLEISMKKDGIYPILNCGCGEWGCGGYSVKVKNKKEEVIWEMITGDRKGAKPFDPLHVKTPIHFSRKNYQDVVKRLLVAKDSNAIERDVYRADLERYRAKGMDALYDDYA